MRNRLPWPTWIERWERAIAAAQRHGATNCRLKYDTAASTDEIEELERSLPAPIPDEFRRTLLQFSRKIDFFWFLPSNENPPGQLAEIFCGRCQWDLDLLLQINAQVAWLSQNAFVKDTPDERLWRDKFAFHPIACGDFIAIDTSSTSGQAVVYLNHELGVSHRHWLGASFFDFMNRWTTLGCPDDDIWPRFVPHREHYIDLDSDNARNWLRWFGLPTVAEA